VEKNKDPIEINKFRNVVSDEVKRVNNQPFNADDSQETRWKNIKGTIDAAAKNLRTKQIGKKCYKILPQKPQ